MRMGHLRIGAFVLAALVLAGGSAVVLAQPEAPTDAARERMAADRFGEGERAFSHGDFAKAGEAFEAAYSIKPHEAALWNAARSWERAGELAAAANLYRRYARSAPDDAPDRKHASAALEALSSKLGRIEIVAPGLTNLMVDGRAVVDAVVFVNPGSHLVSGKSVVDSVPEIEIHKQVTLNAGAVESVVLEAPTPAPLVSASAEPAPSVTAAPVASTAAPAPVPPKPAILPKPHHGTTPWLLVPFAGTTAISGIFLIASGIDVLRARSDYDTLKKGRSPDEQQQLIQEGVAKTDRTNVLIGVTAGLAIVTGVVALTAIDWSPRETSPSANPRASARLVVTPGGASVEARF